MPLFPPITRANAMDELLSLEAVKERRAILAELAGRIEAQTRLYQSRRETLEKAVNGGLDVKPFFDEAVRERRWLSVLEWINGTLSAMHWD